MNINVKCDGEHFYVSLPYIMNHLLEDLPEKKWDKRNSCWKVPATWRAKAPLEHLPGEWTEEAREVWRNLQPPQAAPMADERMLSNYPFVYPPFEHQKECILKAFNQDSFAILFEQGLGKTKTTIDLCGLWHGFGVIDAVVIVCPVSITSVWEKEYGIHYPFPYEVQIMNTKRDIKWSGEGLKVLVVGVESLSQGKTFDLMLDLLPTLGNVCFAVDESSRVKNHKAVRTQRVIELSNMCAKRLILTGTPVTQGIQDLYSQFQVLNPSTIALSSFYAFRNRYCVVEDIRGAPKGAVKIVGYQRVDELMNLVEPWSMRREKQDCLDLPEKTYQTRLVSMSSGQEKAYKELKKNLWTEILKESGEKDRIEVEQVLEAYMRLQQITGGHYSVVKDIQVRPNGKMKKVYETSPLPGSNPKVQELLELLSEVQSKVIVWTRFRSELKAIVKATENIGRETVVFHGGLTKEEKADSVREFQEGTANVLVASYAAAYGLTLTAANTAVYFSMDFGLENFLQSQDRIHRIGQKNACTYILMACAGSVDEDVIDVLLNKKNLADVVSERLKNGEIDGLI